MNPLIGENSKKYMQYFEEAIMENPKNFRRSVNTATRLAYCDMHYEEVRNATKNPFTKRIWISLVICLTGLLIFAICAIFGVADVGGITFTLFAVVAGGGLADNIVKSAQFRKVKKQIEAENEDKER